MDKNDMKRAGWLLGLTLLVVLATAANWAAWLGWDQRQDVLPDGTVRGPYEAWQVIGLGVVQAILIVGLALRRHPAIAVIGTTVGLTLACSWDWSDDASGLWAVGASLVLLGAAMSSGFLAFLAHRLRPEW